MRDASSGDDRPPVPSPLAPSVAVEAAETVVPTTTPQAAPVSVSPPAAPKPTYGRWARDDDARVPRRQTHHATDSNENERKKPREEPRSRTPPRPKRKAPPPPPTEGRPRCRKCHRFVKPTARRCPRCRCDVRWVDPHEQLPPPDVASAKSTSPAAAPKDRGWKTVGGQAPRRPATRSGTDSQELARKKGRFDALVSSESPKAPRRSDPPKVPSATRPKRPVVRSLECRCGVQLYADSRKCVECYTHACVKCYFPTSRRCTRCHIRFEQSQVAKKTPCRVCHRRLGNLWNGACRPCFEAERRTLSTAPVPVGVVPNDPPHDDAPPDELGPEPVRIASDAPLPDALDASTDAPAPDAGTRLCQPSRAGDPAPAPLIATDAEPGSDHWQPRVTDGELPLEVTTDAPLPPESLLRPTVVVPPTPAAPEDTPMDSVQRNMDFPNWIPGTEMFSDSLAHLCWFIVTYTSGANVMPLPVESGRGREDFLLTLQSLNPGPNTTCFLTLHIPEEPLHYVSVWWIGRNPSEILVSDSLGHPHPALAQHLERVRSYFAKAPSIRFVQGCTIAGVGYPLSCGFCCLNDLLSLRLRLPVQARPRIAPESVLSSTQLREALAAASRSAAAAPVRTSFKRPHAQRFDFIPNDDPTDGDTEADPGKQRFRKGSFHLRRTPTTEEVTRQFVSPQIRSLLQLRMFTLPTDPTVLQGITLQQRKRQVYTLVDVLDTLITPALAPSRAEPYPLPLIHAIRQLSSQRQWIASTTINAAATLQGCLSRIDQYCRSQPLDPELHLTNRYSTWKDAMLTWQREAFRHVPKVTEVTLEQVRRMILRLDPTTAILLIVSWLHAARVGNAYNLRIEDLTLDPSLPTDNWSILWTSAKTSGKVGPYSTHSFMPAEWMTLYRSYLSTRPATGPLFDPSKRTACLASLSQALKTEVGKSDIRAIRRGSLCAMAQRDVELETLLTYSGHTTVHMLLRYLRRGKAVSLRAKKGASAARTALC